MLTKRAHVVISEDIVKEIDELVGERKRSRFISEAAKKEIERIKLLTAIKETSGIWKDEDHLELREGTEKFVRTLREENDKRNL